MVIATPDAPSLSQAEVKTVARIAANVEKSKVSDTGMTLAEKANAEAAKAHLDQRQGRESMFTLATGFNHAAAWQKTAERQTLSGFDADGKRVERTGTTENTDLAEIKATTQLYTEYLQRGFDGLKDDSHIPPGLTADDKRGNLIVQVEDFINANPQIADLLKDSSGRVPQDTLKAMLRDKKVMAALAGRLNELYDPKSIQTDLETSLITAEGKAKNAKETISSLTVKRGEYDSAKITHGDRKRKFESDVYTSASIGTIGTKDSAYKALDTDPDVVLYKKVKEQYKIDVAQARNEAQLINAQDKLRSVTNPKTEEYESLFAEREDVNAKLQESTDNLSKTDSELATRQSELASANTEINDALLKRGGGFKEAVTTALRSAVGESYTQKARELMEHYPEYRTEIEEALKKEADEQIAKHTAERWVTHEDKKTGWFGRGKKERVYSYDLSKSQKDIDMVVRDGNPDNYIRDVLEKSGLSVDQANRLMADKGFMDAQRASLVSKALVAHTLAKGELGEGMQSLLRVSSWGREASKKWLEESPDAKAFVEKVTGKPVSEQSLQEMFDKKGKKGVLLALLMALGFATMIAKEAEKMAG